MKRPEFNKYQEILLKLKSQLLNGILHNSIEDLSTPTDDLPDEADLAANIITQEVTFSMKQRELDKLKAIEGALNRIKEGTFGCCEDCGEAIPEKRLQNRPWATLCISHAEEKEREVQKFSRVS